MVSRSLASQHVAVVTKALRAFGPEGKAVGSRRLNLATRRPRHAIRTAGFTMCLPDSDLYYLYRLAVGVGCNAA